MRDYTHRRGLRTIEYIELGISGLRESRLALNDLMRDARLRKFDTVIVEWLHRFSRSTTHLLRALEGFKSLGVEFISLKESISPDVRVDIAEWVKRRSNGVK